MATVAGIKIKNKQPRQVRVAFADEKYTGTEPEWTAEAADWDNERFDNRLRKSFYYYNYYYCLYPYYLLLNNLHLSVC